MNAAACRSSATEAYRCFLPMGSLGRDNVLSGLASLREFARADVAAGEQSVEARGTSCSVERQIQVRHADRRRRDEHAYQEQRQT